MANEKRLIDANAALEKLCECCCCGCYESCEERCAEYLDISKLPTVDAVEVVRCKDCKYYENHKLKVYENCVRNERYIPMKPDDFCSYGERKDNG